MEARRHCPARQRRRSCLFYTSVNHRLTSLRCFSADLWLPFRGGGRKNKKKPECLECFLSISVHQQPFFSVLCCETRGADFPTKNPIDATQWEILPAVSAYDVVPLVYFCLKMFSSMIYSTEHASFCEGFGDIQLTQHCRWKICSGYILFTTQANRRRHFFQVVPRKGSNIEL